MKLRFRTLWDGGAYSPVAVTRGGSQGCRCVRLRCHQLVQQSRCLASALAVLALLEADAPSGPAPSHCLGIGHVAPGTQCAEFVRMMLCTRVGCIPLNLRDLASPASKRPLPRPRSR